MTSAPLPAGALRAPTAADVARLLGASALWGAAFLCNAIALEDFAPVAIAAWRVALAALAVALLCRAAGHRVPTDRRSLALLLAIGTLNGAVPFTLIGWGQESVDPATTAVLVAVSPFATLALSHLLTADERFTGAKLAGLAVGFAGVVLLVGIDAAGAGGSLAGMGAILVAACCYALSALLIRRLGDVPSLAIVAGQLVAASLVLVPVTLVLHPPGEQAASATSLGAIAVLAAGPTALAYVLRTRIVQDVGAVFMSNAGFLIPLFSALWAWLFLDALPGPATWAAMALIFAGLALGRRASGAAAPSAAPAAGSPVAARNVDQNIEKYSRASHSDTSSR